MAEKKHVIEYTDIIKAFEKVKEKLKNKSNKGHQHGNADITDIDASKIKSGTIDIDRLPKGAIERMVYVKDDAARFALTTNTTQNGDTVKVTSTKKMFYVIDDTKLSSEAGYEPYTAESASAVPWSGVTGKPTTFTPEAHTHAISEVADLQETLTGLRQDVNAKPSKDTNTTYSLIQDSTDGHKLTFKGSDGSTKTVTIPDNDHNDNTWRDVVDGLDSTRTDASLSANQGRILNDKFGGYLPLHGTADIAASVTDYGNTAKQIQIGFQGSGISGDDIKFIAGYTDGDGGDLSAKIKDISKDALKSWLGLGSRAYDSTSYLPLSGGDMTGDITFNKYGASTIGTGDKDGAGLDAKNNLNIASWYGVSFTTKCAGLAYSDKPGVSIDCRNGTLAVAGAIYANGGVVGDLTGNAATATTAKTANSATYINYSINKYVTGDSMKTPYWRFATIEVSSDWYDQSIVLLVNTGCVGGGFGIIKLSVRSNQISNTENAYCEFSWLVRRGFDPNQFIVKGYSASKTTNYFDIYFKATGVYQGITVTVLSSGSRGDISFDWKLTNDEPRAAMDLRTYNYELVSSDEGVVDYASTANHLYNTQTDGVKNSMTFNWDGKNGQPTWLWGGTDGSNMYLYNPSNFAVDNAGSIRDSSGNGNLLSASYSKNGLDYSEYTWLAAWNGTELRAVTKGQFATAGHTHGLTHSDLIAAIDATSGGWDLIGGNNGFILKSIRTNASAPKWTIDNFSAAIAFGGADTKGIITIPYSYAGVKFAGGNGDSPRWYFDIFGTNEKSYNLDSFLTSHQDISGKLDKSGGTITGTLHVKPTTGSYTEGMRIYPYDGWSTIMLNGTDNTGTSGTSAKSWGLFNNDGQFYITKNGANTSPTAILSNTDGTWRANGHELITVGNIGSQNVNYANSAGSANSVAWTNVSGRPSSLPANGGTSDYSNKVYATSHPGTWYLDTSWDGTYFQSCFKNGNNTLPMRVANANYADSAGSARAVEWGNVSGRPTALSSFTNDSGYITGSDSRLTNARPASDVYSWAKASSKPSYTWTEISNKPDIPSISHDTPTRTNWTIDSKYNCIVYRIGDFCLAVVAVTGTIYPRQWLPAAQLSKDVTPKTQSSIIISSVSGSDHMECMVTTDGYIKMWWSGSSPATSANICIPYYMG